MHILPAVGLLAVVAVALLGWRTLGGEDDAFVSVYPNHRTLAAAAETSITFRGVDPDELGDVAVTGSRSGRHSGRLQPHPDGLGAAFVPERPFAPGERVTVDAGMRVAGTDEERSAFLVARTLDAPPAAFDDAEPPGTRGLQEIRSRPDLRPPAVAVRSASPGATGSVFVAPKRGASQQGPMILDRTGRLVWFRPLPGDDQAFDFRAQTYRGKPVLTWWQGRVALYKGVGTGRILDSSYRPVATVRAGNGYDLDGHEFQLTDAGTALVISYTTVPWDLSKLGGRRDATVDDNIVQEIDVATGTVLFEWHALGTIGLGESYRPAPRRRGKGHDPFHLNSVALDRDGNLLLSARHTNAVYKVDRSTGEILWRLGGKRSSFAMGDGTTFRLQHDARRLADGTITLFDNVAEDLPARGRRSRGLEIALDEDERTASLVREFEHPDGLLSPTQGSMEPLADGGAFVGWGGGQPFFTEFDERGEVVFDARFGAERVESYRAYTMPWSARAPGRPSVAATSAGGRTRVRVSWNGATEVARWRVRAAGGGAATTAPWRGFETAIDVAGRPRSVIVEALDGSGEVLGASERTAVRGG
jgi:outer membrane protein assembly factor BamB